MIDKITVMFVGVAMIALVSYCSFNPIGPPGSGSIYKKTAQNFNCFHAEDSGCVGADGPKTIGTKTGKACASFILGVYSQGDMSIMAASQEGGITTVGAIDVSDNAYVDIPFFITVYRKRCLIVRGT